jgi:hypothetical protein
MTIVLYFCLAAMNPCLPEPIPFVLPMRVKTCEQLIPLIEEKARWWLNLHPDHYFIGGACEFAPEDGEEI